MSFLIPKLHVDLCGQIMHMIQYGYVPWNKPKKRAGMPSVVHVVDLANVGDGKKGSRWIYQKAPCLSSHEAHKEEALDV